MAERVQTGIRLLALSLSSPIHQWLEHRRMGTVLATFSRSCYLNLDGRIAAVVLPDLLNGPLNIVVEANLDLALDQIPIGSVVQASSARIRIADAVEIRLDQASVWDPRLSRWTKSATAGIENRLDSLIHLVQAEAPEGSFAHYLPGRDPAGTDRVSSKIAERAAPALKQLKEAVVRHSIDMIAQAARNLAGLGGGLTPSGDDVLIGTLVALSVMPGHDRRGFRGAISAAVRGRTTRISEAYLEAAARGEASEAWHTLLRSLTGPDRTAIASAARRVMAFGETSGADMLAGFVLATAECIR